MHTDRASNRTFPARKSAQIARIAQSSEELSISLLNDIDATVDQLQGTATVMTGLSRILDDLTSLVKKEVPTPGEYMDSDDRVIAAVNRATDHLKTMLARMVRSRSAIDRDCRLQEHHCEALHDAYETAEGAVAGLIAVLDDVRSAIITYDMMAEPRADLESFSTIDALIATLHRQ